MERTRHVCAKIIHANSSFTRRKLAGKTVFITGASRGIGKAIALKVARDGANVVIGAKTADPHPKLEGTIFTAAKEGSILIVSQPLPNF